MEILLGELRLDEWTQKLGKNWLIGTTRQVLSSRLRSGELPKKAIFNQDDTHA